ncbi:hypothetical protein [Brasilonema sp. UFV-L1]|uniref:hypothetical protein n=1 Tax=Brasilonema sp. UFV-L1 TaxID=2234130 RepID=UPI00403F1D71
MHITAQLASCSSGGNVACVWGRYIPKLNAKDTFGINYDRKRKGYKPPTYGMENVKNVFKRRIAR